MATRQYKLTTKQANELYQAFLHCAEGETRTRYQAVWLYGTGYPVPAIHKLTGCSRTRLMIWCRNYRQRGRTTLEDHRRGGNAAKLTPTQRQDLKRRLHQYTPREIFGSAHHSATGQFWTLEDLKPAIRSWYSVDYRSRSTLQTLLHASGLSYQRPARIFKSKRVQQIMEFEETLEKNSLTLHKLRPRP